MGDRYTGQNILALIRLDRRQDLERLMEGWDRSILDEKEDNSPWYWYIIALADAYLGDHKDALVSINKAIKGFEGREERISLGRALHQRALFHQQEDALTRARQDARRAIDLFSQCGAKFHQSVTEKFLQQLPA
jgi:tetratricopeptide (TPR) repeat protein